MYGVAMMLKAIRILNRFNKTEQRGGNEMRK